MDQKVVRALEKEIAASVAEVVSRLRRRNDLPFTPCQQTLHLMAKAAVTVYEAAAENRREHLDE
jgi:hypothetical protein